MSIEIIPNQPIALSEQSVPNCKCGGATPCLLVAKNDLIYAQVKMNSCGAEMICGQPVIGEELVVNGGFVGDTGWTEAGNNWTMAGANACYSGPDGAGILYQTIAGLIATRTYRLTFTISDYAGSGTLRPYLWGDTSAAVSANGTYVQYITLVTLANDFLNFVDLNSWDGCIDNISLVEYATCWTETGDANLVYSTTSVCVNGSSTLTSTVAGAALAPVFHVVTFVISNYVSGSLKVRFGTALFLQSYSGNGQKFAYFNFVANNNLSFVFTNFIGCISAVSIKLLFAPAWTFVNQDTGQVLNINATLFQDRSTVSFNPYELGYDYGCWKLCVFDACGHAEYIAANELINPTFQSELGGWTLGDGWALEGQAHYSFAGSSSLIYQTLESAKLYCVKIKVTEVLGVGASLGFTILNGITPVGQIIITEPGVYALCGFMDKVQMSAAGGAGFEYTIEYAYASPIADCDDCTTGYYCSPCIKFAEEFKCTKLIEGYCDDDAFRFVFYRPTSILIFKLQMRVKSEFLHPKYPQEQADYIFSSGKTQLTSGQAEKFQALTFSPLPEYKHDVIALIKLCDTMVIDGVSYFAKKSDYNPEWDTSTNADLAKSKIDVKKKDDTLFNSLCE